MTHSKLSFDQKFTNFLLLQNRSELGKHQNKIKWKFNFYLKLKQDGKKMI